MSLDKKLFKAVSTTTTADAAEGLVLHLDANDEDSIEQGGANDGNTNGTWFDISTHDLNVPLVDKASNLQLHLNASDTTSYGGSGDDWTDISQNSNTASDTSPTFSSDTRGYFVMDGSNDYFTINYDASLYMTSNTGFTIEAWVNRDSGSEMYIIASDDGSTYPYALSWNTNTHGYYGWISGSGFDAGTVVGTSETSTNGVGEWDHVVMTQSSVDRKNRLYVNGTLTSTSSAASGFHSTSSGVNVGAYWNETGKFDGKISVIRIYNVALTASEVAQNFRADCFLNYTSIYSTNLEMNLDASDDTTLTASTWSDKANSNNGTFNNFSSTLSDFYDKELGNWIEFDGTNDIVTVSHNTDLDFELASGDRTFAAWVQRGDTTNEQTIISKGGGVTGYFLNYTTTSNVGYYFYDYGSTSYVRSGTSVSNGVGKWDYVVVTWDLSAKSFDMYVNGTLSNVTQVNATGTPSSTTSDLLISTNDATRGHNFWDGRIGVVKIYTSKLSSAQVAQNYLATKNDYPNGNHATNNGATFTYASTPYHFDFVSNDYFRTPSIPITWTSGFAYEIYFKADTNTQSYPISTSGSSNPAFSWRNYNGWKLVAFHYKSSSTVDYLSSGATSTGQWYHIVYTANDSGGQIYTNGSLSDSTTNSVRTGDYNDYFDIGKLGGGNYLDGKIGMVKIYAKHLSASEVSANYDATKSTYGLS